jgi:alpha-mannosidase
LLNQFHDILPGSSISEVYVDSHRQMEEVIELGECLRDRVLAMGIEPPATAEMIVANAALYSRPLTVLVPPPLKGSLGPNTGLVTQTVDDGVLVSSPGNSVPALGTTKLRAGDPGVRVASAAASTSDEGFVLENTAVRVTIGPDGTLHSVHDKEAHREVLADRANQLWAYVDKPYAWDAWDIDESYARDGEEIAQIERIGITETGPIRVAVTVSRAWRGSTITQSYRLWHDSKRIDIVTDIDWHERQVLLKTHFPLAVRSDHATFETMYGAVTRPTHRNSPFDAAKFEGCGHRFGDVSEPCYGAAILNDTKYGYEALGSDLMLSLLRSPLYPDPLADEGAHHFTYSLLPHIGDWTESSVVQEAFALNSPLIVSTGRAQSSFASVDGLPLSIGALKRAEDGDGLILRVYEPHGGRGDATLQFWRPVQRVVAVDLLEDPIGAAADIAIEANAVSLDFRPFEVKSLRITFA